MPDLGCGVGHADRVGHQPLGALLVWFCIDRPDIHAADVRRRSAKSAGRRSDVHRAETWEADETPPSGIRVERGDGHRGAAGLANAQQAA